MLSIMRCKCHFKPTRCIVQCALCIGYQGNSNIYIYIYIYIYTRELYYTINTSKEFQLHNKHTHTFTTHAQTKKHINISLTFSCWWSTWSFVFPVSAVNLIFKWCIVRTKITILLPINQITIKCNTVLLTKTLWLTVSVCIFVNVKWCLYTSTKFLPWHTSPGRWCTGFWNWIIVTNPFNPNNVSLFN